MPAGLGGFDAQGVWQYGELDVETLASDLFNIGQESVSTQFAADRVRITAAEEEILANRGLVPIIPTVAGTGVTVDPDTGIVTLTAAGASTGGPTPIRLSGLSGYRRVRAEVKVTSTSTATQLATRLRTAAGATDTNNNYYQGLSVLNGSSISASSPAVNGLWTGIVALGSVFTIDQTFEDLGAARYTRGEQRYSLFAATTAPRWTRGDLWHNLQTAYDAIEYTTGDATTVTGTIRLLGEL